MASANLQSKLREPSPLAVDLALASVDLAALRARRGLEELDQEARDAAELLRNYFARRLRMGSGCTEISEKLVPDDSFRQAIEQSLGPITATRPRLGEEDAGLLRELVRLLSALADTGRCEREQAKELHSALRQLDAKPAAPSARTNETNLWELFNALS